MLVLGVGAGSFVVGLVWALAFVVALALSQTIYAKLVYIATTAFAGLVTGILIALPREDESESNIDDPRTFDDFIIGRTVLLICMCIFAVLSLVFIIVLDWIPPVYATPSRK
eukprot:m.50978 g.50978  ORF g.50978 m.50978 type:complete len:112 (-) comp18097_c0_seq1:156-491(-)